MHVAQVTRTVHKCQTISLLAHYQIVTRVLGVPIERIHIKETNTDVAAEGIFTAASTGTDLSGGAVKVKE